MNTYLAWSKYSYWRKASAKVGEVQWGTVQNLLPNTKKLPGKQTESTNKSRQSCCAPLWDVYLAGSEDLSHKSRSLCKNVSNLAN